jgi:hypothetical protein
MKEAVVFVSGFDAQCQNYYLDNYLKEGLLNQLEDIDIKLDPEDVKIPGQTGKRFHCQFDDTEKTIDIYEVYWNDLVDRLSAKSTTQKFGRGISMCFHWFSHGWKIMKISPVFFLQASTILVLVLLWYYGIVVLVLAALAEQQALASIPFLQTFLGQISGWATTGWGWQVWLVVSALLALLPVSISLIIDLTDFFVSYLQNESHKGKPPVRALLRSRVKQAVDNVVSEGSYDRVTVLAHSLGGLIATDFLADYRDRQGRQLRYITWGSALESSSSATDWIESEIKKCLDSPHIEKWEDFYSNQDWFCSKVPVPGKEPTPKLVSKEVSFKVSLAKQITGESHMEYFFDPKVLRHFVMG